jgi:N-sulfoglucosamine sulfohydrolase
MPAFRFVLLFIFSLCITACSDKTPPKKPGESGYQRPNFLFIISDDQSWIHTSFAGYPFVSTPNFDQIASRGVYFENAYAAAPSCTASRSAVLSGQYPWRLKSAAVLGGEWPDEIRTYPQILKQHGYHVGHTGKGWGPGTINNPANLPHGKNYFFAAPKKKFWQLQAPHAQASSFDLFLREKPDNKPFAFWVGIREPHRPYDKGDVRRFKNAPTKDFLPAFLPDTLRVREELSAYLTEIEKYDKILGQIIDRLEDHDQLDNTIIVITSDNGMPFGRAKIQNYQYGVHVPMAIYWKGVTQGHNRVEDMVGLYDIAPSFLEAAEIPIPTGMNGKSFLNMLYSNHSGQIDKDRTTVFTMTERHSPDARPHAMGYPTRAIYTNSHVLIKNYFPDRWPSGNDHKESEPYLLMDETTGAPLEPFFSYANAKRPALELYALASDPYQLNNLAADPQHSQILEQLKKNLESTLVKTGDPLQLSGKDKFSAYPWSMR